MGERFGKYELLSRIGVGGMAEVFHARRFGAEGFVKDVVIKRILPAFTEDADFVDMFIKEARLAVRLTHANIVQVLDFDHVEGHYYIAMEHVDGPDLRRVETVSRRRKVPLPLNLAIHVGVEALKGLHYAHTKDEGGQPLGIVHRDVSPHNLLVSYSGEVKVADFGIAKVAAMASATRPGAVKGKLTYMAPEQIRGANIDHRADLFSLGIVLWELLSGRRLYSDCGSEGEVIAAVQRAEIPPLGGIRPDLPESLQHVVSSLLEPDQDKRFGSAAIALAELSPVAGAGHGLEVSGYLRRLLPEGAQRENKGQTAVVTAGRRGRPTGPEELTRTSDPQVASPAGSAMGPTGTGPTRGGPTRTGPPRPQSAVTLPPSSHEEDRERGFAQRNGAQPSGADPGTGEVDVPSRNRTLGMLGLGLVVVVCAVVAWFAASRLLPGEGISLGAPAMRVGHLKLSSEPPGAEILVDGVSLGRGPSVEVTAPAGQRLRVEARSGAQRAARQVTVEPEKDLRVVLRTAEIGSSATGSSATGSSATGSSATGSSATGSKPSRTPAPQARASSTPPRPTAAAAAATPEAIQPARRRRSPRRTSRGPNRVRRRASDRRSARKSAVVGRGTLDVIVSPWASVQIDGQGVGTAPIKRYRLDAGRHTLRLRNDELGKSEKITVVIKPGQSTRIRRDWLSQ